MSQPCVDIMPEHSAPPGLSGLQHYRPWTSKDLLRRSVKQCELLFSCNAYVCTHTQHGVIVICSVPMHTHSMEPWSDAVPLTALWLASRYTIICTHSVWLQSD